MNVTLRRLGLDVRPSPLRAVALLGAALLLASFLSVINHVLDVVGDPALLWLAVAVTLLGATALAWSLTTRQAVILAGVLLVGGLVWYLTAIGGWRTSPWPYVEFTVAMLAGHSILEIAGLEAWVLAVTPAPVFLTWYLALRRQYASAAVVGGLTALFFVLTGDAGVESTLLGVAGALVVLGVGELDRRGASLGDADVLGVLVAFGIVVSASVSVLPAGAAYAVSLDGQLSGALGSGGGATDGTVEANLLQTDNTLQISGSVSLSPEVRFIVESDQREYWRVGSFDLYTGDGWTRRGENGAVERRLGSPAGPSTTLTQKYRVLSETTSMPAVWRPAVVSGEGAADARVTSLGGLTPTDPLAENETYRVRSKVPTPTLYQLRNAGRDYPASIATRYTQLPESMPDRVAERTRRLTANADTPYETARVIERWLETSRGYSLNVSKPQGNVADAFLFEMERGYCTYFATTMTAMLRTQDIPARFVVGYTSGQQVDNDTWVVRGHDAHAWVEVFFPDVGWIRFDPTPSGPRAAAEQQDLQTARSNNVSNVDVPESVETARPTDTETATETQTNLSAATRPRSHHAGLWYGNNSPEFDPGSIPASAREAFETTEAGTDQRGDGPSIPLPTAEQTTLGALTALGVAGVARRTGLIRRARRTVYRRWQPRADPETDVLRAFDRLEGVLEARHRDRQTGETVRDYLDAIDADDRARRVATIRERARYGGTVTERAADEAVDLVDELIRE
ncbi:MAG: DUF3488 and DUF4129 domain-containing transglutaminase family protein [Halorhabdus sp.]